MANISETQYLADLANLAAIERVECIEHCQSSFWEYCHTIAPEFYKPNRAHLKSLCDTLQKLYNGQLLDADGVPYRKLIIQMPPQHGKSRTLVNFNQWVFGQNPNEKIICCSYNDLIAQDFAQYTRDGIQAQKNEPVDLVFADIFPNVKIKHGSASKQRWALEGQHFSFISAGVRGSITSKGGTIIIIDDPIKDIEDALNDEHLNKIWRWYTGTLLSRVSAERGEPLEIIVMTPWVQRDLVGRILDSKYADLWYMISMPAMDDDGRMLCEDLLAQQRFDYIRSMPETVHEVFQANYMMQRIDLVGKLYKSFLTYDSIPLDVHGRPLFKRIEAYVDTADQGTDYLCVLVYGIYNGCAYVLDALYTMDGMEVTEPATAELLKKNEVNLARIESNSGGRGFGRNVRAYLINNLAWNKTMVHLFFQSGNKRSRIISNSNWAMQKVIWPTDWKNRWPVLFNHLNSYLKEGKQQPDDAPDVLAGIAENMKTLGWG